MSQDATPPEGVQLFSVIRFDPNCFQDFGAQLVGLKMWINALKKGMIVLNQSDFFQVITCYNAVSSNAHRKLSCLFLSLAFKKSETMVRGDG